MKKIRVSENELVNLIEKLVKENLNNGNGQIFPLMGAPTDKYKDLLEKDDVELEEDNGEEDNVRPLIFFIPDPRTYSVPLFLKRQRGQTPGARRRPGSASRRSTTPTTPTRPGGRCSTSSSRRPPRSQRRRRRRPRRGLA